MADGRDNYSASGGVLGGTSVGSNTTNTTNTPSPLYNTTPCLNDYCVSMDDYVDLVQLYIYPTPFEWVLISLYIIVFTVGLAGNFLVCFAVWRNQHMRTVTNLFIVNLAVADFLVIFICLPPTVLDDITLTWYMGRYMCKIVKYLQVSALTYSTHL